MHGAIRMRLCRRVVAFCLVSCLAFVPGALQAENHQLPAQPVAAALLMDLQSGAVLHAVAADTSVPPASLTKIMTLFVVFDALAMKMTAMEDVIHVDGSVRGTYGATLGLEPGDTLTVGEAVRGVAVASANDAATALAVHVAGSEQAFVKRMNQKAAGMGLDKTHYDNAHGLPSANQRTSARDVASLSTAYILRYPQALDIHHKRSFSFRGKMYTNRNTLLNAYTGLDGLKTGYIKASGYCLVSTAMRGERRLLSVVLGAASPEARDAASAELLDYGFTMDATAASHQ